MQWFYKSKKTCLNYSCIFFYRLLFNIFFDLKHGSLSIIQKYHQSNKNKKAWDFLKKQKSGWFFLQSKQKQHRGVSSFWPIIFIRFFLPQSLSYFLSFSFSFTISFLSLLILLFIRGLIFVGFLQRLIFFFLLKGLKSVLHLMCKLSLSLLLVHTHTPFLTCSHLLSFSLSFRQCHYAIPAQTP